MYDKYIQILYTISSVEAEASNPNREWGLGSLSYSPALLNPNRRGRMLYIYDKRHYKF